MYKIFNLAALLVRNQAKIDRGRVLSIFSLNTYNKNFILEWKKSPWTADYKLKKIISFRIHSSLQSV